MANIKVSEMTEATSFDDGDYTMIVQANQNKKISHENILGNIENNISTINTNIGNLSNLATDDKTSLVNSINELKEREIYSTDEIKTNKIWLDGKPIYKITKTYTVTGSTSTDISELNIENLIDYNSICYRYGNIVNDYEKPYYSGASDYFRSFIRLNTNTIETRITISGNYNVYQIFTTIYYTKTTD